MQIKASISFGLVYIPIKLEVAAKKDDISFNQIHKSSNKRVRYKKVIEGTDEEVLQEDILKGYEYEKGKYVVLTEEDFSKIRLPKDKSLKILAFIDSAEIDPIYYDKTYYVVPDGSDKPFSLLRRAMSEMGKSAIAEFTLSKNSSLASIRLSGDTMLLSTLYYAQEIVSAPYVPKSAAASEQEIELAKLLINSLSKPFNPEEYRNEYKERLTQAIMQKIEGKEIIVEADQEPLLGMDLLAALQASIEQGAYSPQ